MRLASLIFLRTAFLGLILLLVTGSPGRAGIAAYSDRGKIDFDTAMSLLNPYGTWKKVDGSWAYTPLDHDAPYTNGRWLYTEFGWTWQGREPHSWLTEHYGYWKRGEDHVWAWYPGAIWLPQTVEIRVAANGVGWRSAEVDRDGNFVEPESVRFTKIDEWNFVSPAQFAGPITPAVMSRPEATQRLLEDSTDSMHTYLTYREIDRPGPHPADFVNLGDGRMFAPMSDQDRQKAVRQAKTPAKPGAAQAEAEGSPNPDADTRQVKYWVTLSLPTYWTKPPADAQINEIYLYRPDFYQDPDGIQRRISLWLDPGLRTLESLHLSQALAHSHPAGASGATSNAAPSTPAVPAEPAANPFANPLDAPFPASHKSSSQSTKNPLSAAGAPIDTNTAPVPAQPAQ